MILFVTTCSNAADWPQYLGPNRNATSSETGLLRSWPKSGPKVLWTVPLGPGYGGAAVSEGKVYVLDPATGSLIDSYDLEESLAASPVINGTDIIFATRRGAVYKIDTVLNQADLLATLEDVTINGPLAFNDGIIYIHTQDALLQRINAENGALLSPVDLKSGT